jgi:hypothetical protein
MSLDVVENQHYITKWVEDTIINGVRNTDSWVGKPFVSVEYTIQNGVKETTPSGYLGSIEMKGKIVHQIESPKQNNEVEDTIQNGVRHTEVDGMRIRSGVKDAIQNGVKDTVLAKTDRLVGIEDTIQSGIKDVSDRPFTFGSSIDDAIENGVKETREVTFLNQMFIEETIEKVTPDGGVEIPSDMKVGTGLMNMVKELRDNEWRTFEHHDNWIKNEHYPNPTFEQQFDTGNAYKEMLKTKI